MYKDAFELALITLTYSGAFALLSVSVCGIAQTITDYKRQAYWNKFDGLTPTVAEPTANVAPVVPVLP